MSADVVEFGTGLAAGDDEAVTPRSLADRIKADLAERRRRVVEIVHPDVPKWRATYRLPADANEIEPFRARAEKAAKRKQPYSFEAAILATFNESLTFMGEPLEDETGAPATFRDREVMNLLDAAGSPSAAVRALYGSDGIVGAVAEQLLDAAGYGTSRDVQVDAVDEDAAPDPTRRG